MKSFPLRFLALAAALLPGVLGAAAFNGGVVSADAKWVVQVDLASFRDSNIGKEVVASLAKMQSEQKASPVQIDVPKLFTTLGTVTAYGSVYSPDPKKLDGTLLIQGTPELRKIAEGYVAQATVSTPDRMVLIKDFPVEAYAMGNATEQLVIAFPPEPVILVSKSKEQLLKAREVFRGAAPSLAKASDSPLKALLATGKEPYLRAACLMPSGQEFPGGAPQARILQMAQSAGLAIGETDTQAFVHLQLLASSDDMADKLQKIVTGLAAMASLTESNDKQLTEFLQSIGVKREARTVTLDGSYSSQRLVQLIRDMNTKKPSGPHGGHREQKIEGRVIDTWVADQDLGANSPTPALQATRTIENVALKQGMAVVISGQREDGEHARLDAVEVIPSAGGAALRFEAENMVLSHYSRESLPFASGGKVVLAREFDPASARFQFPAADGSYTIKVRYLDENDGKSKFSVSLIDPPTGDENGNAASGQ